MPVHFFGLHTLCRLNFILKGLYCTCIWTMVIVQKCAAPRGCQSDTEREEEERGGGEESPSGRIQRGRRQHGKGSRNTPKTWPTARRSLAALGWHSTLLLRPHKHTSSLWLRLTRLCTEIGSSSLVPVHCAHTSRSDAVRLDTILKKNNMCALELSK